MWKEGLLFYTEQSEKTSVAKKCGWRKTEVRKSEKKKRLKILRA